MDSNILIYTFDSYTPHKQEKVRELVAMSLKTQKGIISFQVVQEFLNVATRKFEIPLTSLEAEKYINQVLIPLCNVFANMKLYVKTVKIMERWQYSFYDSLIYCGGITG
jgi:predicted nucleic acid-binding protein